MADAYLSGPEEVIINALEYVRKAIRAKVLESYRNGQAAGPRKAYKRWLPYPVAHAAQGIDEKLLRAKLPLALTSSSMDQETKNEFKSLRNFLARHMVTKQELQDLRDDLPTRAEFAQLQTSVDGIARQFKNTDQELLVGGERTSRMEKWIQRAAGQIDVEYKP